MLGGKGGLLPSLNIGIRIIAIPGILPYITRADVACDGYRAAFLGPLLSLSSLSEAGMCQSAHVRSIWDKGIPYDYWYCKILQP